MSEVRKSRPIPQRRVQWLHDQHWDVIDVLVRENTTVSFDALVILLNQRGVPLKECAAYLRTEMNLGRLHTFKRNGVRMVSRHPHDAVHREMPVFGQSIHPDDYVDVRRIHGVVARKARERAEGRDKATAAARKRRSS